MSSGTTAPFLLPKMNPPPPPRARVGQAMQTIFSPQTQTSAHTRNCQRHTEGVVAPRAHRVRTVATISSHTRVHHPKMHPPKQPIPYPRTAELQAQDLSSWVLFMVANTSQRLLSSFCSFLEAS